MRAENPRIQAVARGTSLAISPVAMRVFRRRYRVLLFALFVAAFVVPVGFALSLESSSASASLPVVATAVAAPSSIFPTVPQGAKLFFVGMVLFALAAAVRKAI